MAFQRDGFARSTQPGTKFNLPPCLMPHSFIILRAYVGTATHAEIAAG